MEEPKHLQQRGLSERLWVDRVPPEGAASAAALSRRLDISAGLAQVLAARNLADEAAASRFLQPEAGQLHSPFLMRDMEAAVKRLTSAVYGYDKILVFGDYDVDGTASATIIYGYLKRLGARVHYYIPHRLEDGYGFAPETVAKIKGWKVDLVVTTDQGSTDWEGAERLREQGIDLIITDHHRMGEQRPPAAALVNPQQPGCDYPFKDLAAAGVAYKVVCAMDAHLAERDFWDQRGICHTDPAYFLDLVAIATVADMAPLLGENRVLVKLGLEVLNTNPKPGLSGLIKECHLRSPITPSTISFKLAPKINALGRVGEPRLAMQLLLSHSFSESRRLARQLVSVNRERQAIERAAYAGAQAQMEEMDGAPALILIGSDWHPGVLGSLATRIAYQSHKPTLVLTMSQGQVVGSARSRDGFSVLKALHACADLLDRFGGHPNAAGLAMQPERLNAFTERFMQEAQRMHDEQGEPGALDELAIEAWLDPDALTLQFVNDIARLSPFGYRNPEPVVAVRGLTVHGATVFNNRHLRITVQNCNGLKVEAFAWEQAQWQVSPQRYDVAFVPQVQHGQDGARAQLRVVDLRRSQE